MPMVFTVMTGCKKSLRLTKIVWDIAGSAEIRRLCPVVTMMKVWPNFSCAAPLSWNSQPKHVISYAVAIGDGNTALMIGLRGSDIIVNMTW